MRSECIQRCGLNWPGPTRPGRPDPAPSPILRSVRPQSGSQHLTLRLCDLNKERNTWTHIFALWSYPAMQHCQAPTPDRWSYPGPGKTVDIIFWNQCQNTENKFTRSFSRLGRRDASAARFSGVFLLRAFLRLLCRLQHMCLLLNYNKVQVYCTLLSLSRIKKYHIEFLIVIKSM